MICFLIGSKKKKRIVMKVCPCVFSQALVEKIVSPILCSSSACGTGKQKKKRIVSPVETEVGPCSFKVGF